MKRLATAGADGLVLFNRFYQPDFDIEELNISPTLDLSSSSDLRLPLRWIALQYGQVDVDFALTSGVHSATDILKAMMAERESFNDGIRIAPQRCGFCFQYPC